LSDTEETEDDGGEAEYFFHDLLLFGVVHEALLYGLGRREFKRFSFWAVPRCPDGFPKSEFLFDGGGFVGKEGLGIRGLKD